VRVEGDVAIEQGREDVHRPIGEARRIVGAGGLALTLGGEEVEDLLPEHVDAAVGEVGERLRGVGLLLKALHTTVGTGDHDPELTGVRDALCRQRGDPAVRAMKLAHRREVDVGKRVSRDDEEVIAEEVGHATHATRSAQQSLLLAVAQLDPQP